MIKILSILTLIMLIVTMGCGFAIHFGGSAFKNAVTGHMVLGGLTLVLVIVLVIGVFR